MPILTVILVAVACGVVIWLINKVPFIDGSMKNIIKWIVILAFIFWVLKIIGVFSYLSHISL